MDFKCDACQGDLKYDSLKNKWVCEYCALEYDKDKYTNIEKETSFSFYHCPSCYNNYLLTKSKSLRCPICSSELSITNPQNISIDYVIPFKLDRVDAINIIKKYFKNKLFIPSILNKAKTLDKIRKVYLSKHTCIITEHEKESDCSSLIRLVEPYQNSNRVLFTIDNIDNTIILFNDDIDDLKDETTIYPLWYLSYEYLGKKYQIIINGESGKIYVDKIVDMKKIFVTFILITIILMCISYILFFIGVSL